MRVLFLSMSVGLTAALFFGIFLSEYYVNRSNYEQSLELNHQELMWSINPYFLEALSNADEESLPDILDKWETLSGYEIDIVDADQIESKLNQLPDTSQSQLRSALKSINQLPQGEFWIGLHTTFFQDDIVIFTPHPNRRQWIVYHEIDSRTPEENKIFLVNQLTIILPLCIALLIFLTPLVRTINALNQALKRFSEGQLTTSVTERGPQPLKSLLRQFNKMTEALKNKIEEQELMTHAMSHELKSPITRLRFALDMAGRTQDPNELAELLEEMDIDLSDLDDLTTELLTLAKVAAGSKNWQFETIDYRCLIETQLKQISPQQSNITVKLNGNAEGFASRQHMDRVFANILSNGLKYAKNNVWITLSTQDTDILCIVEDDGEGVDESSLQKLFMPLFRVDSSRNRRTGGHGIGLAIVWNIINHHKGSVEVSNGNKGGLRMTLRIPKEIREQE